MTRREQLRYGELSLEFQWDDGELTVRVRGEGEVPCPESKGRAMYWALMGHCFPLDFRWISGGSEARDDVGLRRCEEFSVN